MKIYNANVDNEGYSLNSSTGEGDDIPGLLLKLPNSQKPQLEQYCTLPISKTTTQNTLYYIRGYTKVKKSTDLRGLKFSTVHYFRCHISTDFKFSSIFHKKSNVAIHNVSIHRFDQKQILYATFQ
jgi:hypothetical protein